MGKEKATKENAKEERDRQKEQLIAQSIVSKREAVQLKIEQKEERGKETGAMGGMLRAWSVAELVG